MTLRGGKREFLISIILTFSKKTYNDTINPDENLRTALYPWIHRCCAGIYVKEEMAIREEQV